MNEAFSRTVCTVIDYARIAIVKREFQLDASLFTQLQILSVSVFEKVLISDAFQPLENFENMSSSDKQWNLFAI